MTYWVNGSGLELMRIQVRPFFRAAPLPLGTSRLLAVVAPRYGQRPLDPPADVEALNCDWHSLEESASDNHVHHGFSQLEPAPIGYIFGAYLVDRERNK
jgi:hypothetical protein